MSLEIKFVKVVVAWGDGRKTVDVDRAAKGVPEMFNWFIGVAELQAAEWALLTLQRQLGVADLGGENTFAGAPWTVKVLFAPRLVK